MLQSVSNFKLFLALCCFGVCVVLTTFVYGGNLAKAPPVDLVIIGDKKVSLDSLRGRPVLITFWATTCGSCIKEIPHLVDAYQKYHDRGLEIIAVAMPYDPPAQVWQMVQDRKLPYRVALDVNGAVSKAFSPNGTPSTFMIAPNGDLVFRKDGLLDYGKVKQLIEFYLQENEKRLAKQLS